jgi:hypothetical protein
MSDHISKILGTKDELRLRLEEFLVKEGAVPSPEIDRTLKARSSKFQDTRWLDNANKSDLEEIHTFFDDLKISEPVPVKKPIKTYGSRKKL